MPGSLVIEEDGEDLLKIGPKVGLTFQGFARLRVLGTVAMVYGIANLSQPAEVIGFNAPACLIAQVIVV